MTDVTRSAITTQFRTLDGLSIRFAESEDRDEQALLLSPWPDSPFAFEPTWAGLAEHTHLVAVDLPGFGHSERRDERNPHAVRRRTSSSPACAGAFGRVGGPTQASTFPGTTESQPPTSRRTATSGVQR
jgi:pimeloyl-ACP methyl ester carboxylesterase